MSRSNGTDIFMKVLNILRGLLGNLAQILVAECGFVESKKWSNWKSDI